MNTLRKNGKERIAAAYRLLYGVTMLAKIVITLKNGVLDPAGQATMTALSSMGFSGVREVQIGKYIHLSLDTADRTAAAAQVEEMCQKLLANTVIEKYSYTLEDSVS